jgi:hypothetical protein
MKKILRILLACLSALTSANALASTLTAPLAPSSYQVGSNSMISFNWTLENFGNGGGTADSSNGTFTLTTGTTIPPQGGPQSLATPIAAGGGFLSVSSPTIGIFFAPESITVPAAAYDAARQNNLTTIYYARRFTTTEGTTVYAFLQINLTFPATNPNAALNISRVALRFSDNTSVKVIQPDTHIMAVADISYTGSGLFDAMWEIAEPVSTMGQPVFVPIQPVRQFLVAGGRVYLQTPVLPTQKQGLHILRLRVIQPALNFTAPILQYSVSTQGDISSLPTLPPVRINAPLDNALLAADTRFEWQPVKSAHAYQLELFLPEQAGLKPDEAAIAKRAPASGMMVPAKRNSLTLGELSRNKLRPNTTYYWRVIAIGNSGQILSSSALREIRIP